MARSKRKEKLAPELENDFNADTAPYYDGERRSRFNQQGRVSFIDEWHTFYRRWVKNE